MKIVSYLQSLLPSFGKDQVLEDCRLTKSEIKDITLAGYVTAEGLLKGFKFKSQDVNDKLTQFNRIVKHTSGPFVSQIIKGLNQAAENLDEVEKQVGKTYNEEVSGLGLTYLKANLLQFVEACGFVSKYARKFLLYIYVQETAALPDSGTQFNSSLAPAERAWLEANFLSFCTAFQIVSTPSGELKKVFANIPDIVVTADNASTLGSTIGEAKLDPLSMKLIGTPMALIYHVAMFVAEWQANRYKAAQEELRLCQLRKLNLERLLEGKPDARIQRELDHMESRVQSLNFRIAKMEQDNA